MEAFPPKRKETTKNIKTNVDLFGARAGEGVKASCKVRSDVQVCFSWNLGKTISITSGGSEGEDG